MVCVYTIFISTSTPHEIFFNWNYFFQALSGNVSVELLDSFLLQNDFLAIAPPKSTGREMYGVEFTKTVIGKAEELHLSPNDVLRTATGIEMRVIWL